MIRNFFSSMWHGKIRVMLILVLSMVTFFLSLVTLTNSFAFSNQISMVKNLFASNLDEVYRIDVSYIENFDTVGTSFAELKNYINQQEGTICGAYDQSGEYFDELRINEEYISLNKRAYAGTFRADTPEIAEVVFIDPEILNLISGEYTPKDFQTITQNGNTYLPLYVGKDFESTISIGDVFTLSRNGEKYIVKGFLDDQRWFDDSDPITMPTISLNHRFLAPFSETDKTDAITQQSTVGKIFVGSTIDVRDEISDMALQVGIKLRITSIRDFIDQWKADNIQILKLNYFLVVIVMLCSIISIISTLCVNVLLRKKEYGIRIAFGATKKQIIISLCAEMLTINVVAAIIAFTYCYHNYANSAISSFQEIYINTLCSTSLVSLILLILFLVIITLLVPVSILARYNPVELVKEEE